MGALKRAVALAALAAGVDAAECRGPSTCGCSNNEFCNFDYGSSGGCESCSSFSSAAACGQDNLPSDGEDDCVACCFGIDGGVCHRYAGATRNEDCFAGMYDWGDEVNVLPDPKTWHQAMELCYNEGRNCAQRPCRRAFARVRVATTTGFTSGRLRSASSSTPTTRRHVSRRRSQQSRPCRRPYRLPFRHQRQRRPCRRRCHLPGRRRRRRRQRLPLSQQQPGRRTSQRPYRRIRSQRAA